jgi:signal transduction histidine kinase
MRHEEYLILWERVSGVPDVVGVEDFGVMHSLKNHIFSLRVLIGLIEPGIAGSGYEKYHRLMKRELEDIAQLILCIQNGIDRNRQQVNVKDLLKDLFSLMAPRSELSGVETELDLPDNLPEIRGNLLLLAEAFRNVWENAIEAMDRGGTLRISAAISHDREGRPFVEVTFKDNGPGIPEEIASSIATPFLTTKQHGMGLGLSTAKSVAQKHGGELLISSGSWGTSVTFRLPA